MQAKKKKKGNSALFLANSTNVRGVLVNISAWKQVLQVKKFDKCWPRHSWEEGIIAY
jgi:hypothetical protein